MLPPPLWLVPPPTILGFSLELEKRQGSVDKMTLHATATFWLSPSFQTGPCSAKNTLVICWIVFGPLHLVVEHQNLSWFLAGPRDIVNALSKKTLDLLTRQFHVLPEVSLFVLQVDDPDPDIADSVNYPDIRFFRSEQVYGDEPYPDATVSTSWSVPDGGKWIKNIRLGFFMLSFFGFCFTSIKVFALVCRCLLLNSKN